jgi:hypothetical protein
MPTMKTALVHFKCNRGQDFPLKFLLRPKGSLVPIDLTGATILFQARKQGLDTLVAGWSLSTVSGLTYDSNTGYVTGKVGYAVTAHSDVSKESGLDYIVEIRWSNGDRERAFEGNIIFSSKRWVTA